MPSSYRKGDKVSFTVNKPKKTIWIQKNEENEFLLAENVDFPEELCICVSSNKKSEVELIDFRVLEGYKINEEVKKAKIFQEEILEKLNFYEGKIRSLVVTCDSQKRAQRLSEEKIKSLQQKYQSQKEEIEGLQQENRTMDKKLKEFQRVCGEKMSSLQMSLQKHEIGGSILKNNYEKHFDIFHREKYDISKHVISPPMRKKEEIEEQVTYSCFESDSFTFQFFFSVITGSVSKQRSIDFKDLRVALNGELVEKIAFSPHSIEFSLEFPKIGLYELTCIFKNVSESIIIKVLKNELCVEKCELRLYRGEIEPSGDITTSSQSTDRFRSEDTIQVFLSLLNENGVPLNFKSVKDFEFTTKIVRKGEKKKIKGVLSRENDIEIEEDEINEKGEFCVCSIDEKALESGTYVVRVSDDFSLTKTFTIE